MMKKKVFSDSFINIVATIIPMIGLQFIILPIISTRMSSADYGHLITIVAFMNLSASSMGNVLNNLKLINHKEYKTEKISGDYMIFLVSTVIINIIIMIIGTIYYGQESNVIGSILIIISSVLLLIKGYAKVEFRIKLNFLNILKDNIYLLLGYLVGLIFFIATDYWQFIYLFGFTFSFYFIYSKTEILKEPVEKTVKFEDTKTQLIFLLLSGILASLGTYVDKLLIYPVLGAQMVTIYYVATILGKTISLVIQPLTGVMLSYFSHISTFSTKNFKFLIKIAAVSGFIGFLLAVLISRPVLTLLYPQFVNEAMQYVPITTASIIITLISNIINVVLMKFKSIDWQLKINALHMFIYMLFSFSLLYRYNLIGFCIGVLIASIFKLFIMVYVFYLNNKKVSIDIN